MPIFRGLLLVAAVWLVFVISRHLLRSHRARTASPPAPTYIATVDCASCGLRIPKTEAVTDGNRYFCCTQHRDQKIHAIGDDRK